MSELIYNEYFELFIVWLGGYLIGSIPFGWIITYLAGLEDIRKFGSQNIGATNVLRTGHPFLATLTLLLDSGKGIVALLLIGHQFPLVTAIGAMLGHIFPVWLRFQGGKGVATALGILFVLSWPVGLIVCSLWLITAFVFRYASLAALLAFGLGPFVASAFVDQYYAMTIFSMSLLIIVRHHSNIRRLLRGQENRLSITPSHKLASTSSKK